MKLRYYISGHGLGHVSRSCQIIATLHQNHPEIDIDVSSPAQKWFLDAMLGGVPVVSTEPWDIGVVQRDSLVIDYPGTIKTCEELLRSRSERIAREAASLSEARVDLVACDIPAMPCAAAAAAGLPAFAIGNFSWDWIYNGLASHYSPLEKEFKRLATLFADDYRHATLLQLPFAAPAENFRSCEAMPLVARHARQSREQTCERLAIASDRKIGLISFGGFGLENFDFSSLASMNDWVFITERDLGSSAPNIVSLINGHYFYPDLVAAADVVITKPGYGIVSEAIANHSAVLYTSRGDFPEEPLLIEGLQKYTRCREISNQKLRCGDWYDSLEALLAQPDATATLPTYGAEAIARRLAESVGVGT